MCLSVNKTTVNHAKVDEILEARLVSKSSFGDNLKSHKVFAADFLAKSTQTTRQFFEFLTVEDKRFKKSIFYKILTRTTQPAHVASILLVLTISYCMWPEMHKQDVRQSNSLTTFVYLGSFAAHFGAQLWMTFVSGLALYFGLPRHTFGMCQEILFPKYFLINTLLSSMTLVTFAKVDAREFNTRWMVQLASVLICVVIEMTIYLYLTPSLLKLMRQKYQFEQKLGNGQEIGYQETFPGLRCPRYQQIHKNFRKLHMKCAIGNVITICCSFIHLYNLATNISLTL